MAKTAMFDSSKVSVNPTVSDNPKGYENVGNPYTGLTYNQGWFDRLMGDLGFRTKADAFQESMQMQANEFATNLALKAHDEQYNSPAAQAARMRAAGINPDLSDEVTSGSTPPMSEDTNPPSQEGMAADNPMQVAGDILKGVSMGLGFAKDLASLTQMQESIEAQQIGNSQGLFDFANSTFGMMIPSDVMEAGTMRTDWKHDAYARGYAFADRLSPKVRKKYLSQLDLFVNSMDQHILGKTKVAQDLGASADVFAAGSRAGASHDLQEVATTTAEIISDLAATNALYSKEVEQSELGARQAKADYEREYFENLDPTSAASAQNTTNELTTTEKGTRNTVLQPVAKGMKKLSKLSEEGNFLASAALTGISYLAVSSPMLSSVLRVAKISKVSKFIRK